MLVAWDGRILCRKQELRMSDEKNEKPTHKKLEDARKKGQVGMSRDLARLAMLVVVMELALGTEPLWRESIESLMAQLGTRAGAIVSQILS